MHEACGLPNLARQRVRRKLARIPNILIVTTVETHSARYPREVVKQSSRYLHWARLVWLKLVPTEAIQQNKCQNRDCLHWLIYHQNIEIDRAKVIIFPDILRLAVGTSLTLPRDRLRQRSFIPKVWPPNLQQDRQTVIQSSSMPQVDP
jgi:hypothetical protein